MDMNEFNMVDTLNVLYNDKTILNIFYEIIKNKSNYDVSYNIGEFDEITKHFIRLLKAYKINYQFVDKIISIHGYGVIEFHECIRECYGDVNDFDEMEKWY